MAFYNGTDLIKRCIVRLRQVAGSATQLYSEDVLRQLLEETYEMCREMRYWDHMMVWHSRTLTGTDGLLTTPITGLRAGYADIKAIYIGDRKQPMVDLGDVNPFTLTGAQPRYIQRIGYGIPGQHFRVWPNTAQSSEPVRVFARTDPDNVLTNLDVTVPFDATALINGACAKYAVDDGTNPATVAMLQSVFDERMSRLQLQHDNARLRLDPRMTDSYTSDQWQEMP